jgi:hypothetical protein
MVLSGGQLYTAGLIYPTGLDEQAVVLKYGTDGTPIWDFQWGTTDEDQRLWDVAVVGNDIYAVGAVGPHTGANPWDLLVLKLLDEGSTASYVNSATYDGPAADIAWGIVVVDDHLYIVGSTDVGGNTDAILLKYDTDLNLLKEASWGGSGDDSGYDIAYRDGTLYTTGVVDGEMFLGALEVSCPLPGDINDDGDVDLSDLALLLSNYGRSCW